VIQQKQKNSLLNWELVSVNPNEKNWGWKDLFCFWGNATQSVIGFSLFASLYLIYNINFFIVVFGFLIAAFLVYIFANLIGKPSQKHGLPFPVILRTSMGINGAKYIAMLRGVVGIFMFGVQTFFISKSIGYLIRIILFTFDKNILQSDFLLIFFMGMNTIDIICFLITFFIQYLLFSKGQKTHKSFINFSAIFVYFGLSLFLLIIVVENFAELKSSLLLSINYQNIFLKNNIYPLLSVVGTLFAYFSIVLVNFGDFSRYVKNENDLNFGNLSLLVNLVLFSLFSILIVLGADIILTKNMIEVNQLLTNPTDIIGKFDNTFLTFVALFFILFASTSTNLIANYIPSQNALINLFPSKLNSQSSGYVIIIFGFFVGLFWTPVLSQIGILSFIDTFGTFFGPIFGIIIVDYYIIKSQTIDNKDIYSLKRDSAYYYSSGWQLKGIYSLLIGFIFASSTIWNGNLMFLQTYAWLIGALSSSIVYYLLASK
tara:strand:+ start:137 stop:1594 length:1458 start_codon:yes stop_codon:yes gene_type:complete